MSRREYPTPRQWRNRIALFALLTYTVWTIAQLVVSPL